MRKLATDKVISSREHCDIHILIRCLIILVTVCFAYSTHVGERRIDWLGLLLDLEREQRPLKGWNCPFPTTSFAESFNLETCSIVWKQAKWESKIPMETSFSLKLGENPYIWLKIIVFYPKNYNVSKVNDIDSLLLSRRLSIKEDYLYRKGRAHFQAHN